jgi:hypothetical protein
MVRKTKYDLNVFRDLVVSGSGKTEIMKEMGIRNASTFNNLILKLMDEDKKYYQVKEPRKTKQKKPATVKIGKNNTLSLSSKLLSGSVFKPGDTFTVKIFKNRINLTLVEK